jgi:hypothetical protein
MSNFTSPDQATPPVSNQMLSDKVYNFIKMLVQLALPAFSTLYLSLAGVWSLPYAQQIVGTSAALATFFGVVLRLSNRSYVANDANYDGKVVITTNEDGVKLYSLELHSDPDAIDVKDSINFKVKT